MWSGHWGQADCWWMPETRGVTGSIGVTAWQGEQKGSEDGQCAGDRRGDSTVETPAMRKLMGAAADKSINVVMGMLLTRSVIWCPGIRRVMGWPLPMCKVLGSWAQGTEAAISPIPALNP